MTRTRTFALLPIWAIAVAALLFLVAVRAQLVEAPLFNTQGHHASAPQLGSGPSNGSVIGNQPANGQSGNSVITRTGTTSPAPAAPQSTANSQGSGGPDTNTPCVRTSKPAAMCPVIGGT